jgi:hypothetical protein
MKYKEHFIANAKVAAWMLLMSAFHMLHAIIPVKYTAHKYWHIGE